MQRTLWLLLVGLLAVASSACAPAVGDECASNIECDTQDGAVCDITVPGGYCTVPDCVPNACPNDSVCVDFDDISSFCMLACLEDADCRDGQTCRDLGTYGEPGYGYCYVAGQE